MRVVSHSFDIPRMRVLVQPTATMFRLTNVTSPRAATVEHVVGVRSALRRWWRNNRYLTMQNAILAVMSPNFGSQSIPSRDHS